MGVAATALVFSVCIILPEALLSDPDTPYGFTDRGYYERYAEEYETDTGLEY